MAIRSTNNQLRKPVSAKSSSQHLFLLQFIRYAINLQIPLRIHTLLAMSYSRSYDHLATWVWRSWNDFTITYTVQQLFTYCLT